MKKNLNFIWWFIKEPKFRDIFLNHHWEETWKPYLISSKGQLKSCFAIVGRKINVKFYSLRAWMKITLSAPVKLANGYTQKG